MQSDVHLIVVKSAAFFIYDDIKNPFPTFLAPKEQ